VDLYGMVGDSEVVEYIFFTWRHQSSMFLSSSSNIKPTG